MTLTQQWRYPNLLETAFTYYFLRKVSWVIGKSFLAVSIFVLIDPSRLRNLFTRKLSTFKTPVNNLNNVNGIHVIIFMPAFPLRRVTRATALGGLEIPHGQQQFQIVLLGPHQDETKQGLRWPTTSGPLSRGFSQQGLLRQSYVGILDTWPNQRSCWYTKSRSAE